MSKSIAKLQWLPGQHQFPSLSPYAAWRNTGLLTSAHLFLRTISYVPSWDRVLPPYEVLQAWGNRTIPISFSESHLNVSSQSLCLWHPAPAEKAKWGERPRCALSPSSAPITDWGPLNKLHLSHFLPFLTNINPNATIPRYSTLNTGMLL